MVADASAEGRDADMSFLVRWMAGSTWAVLAAVVSLAPAEGTCADPKQLDEEARALAGKKQWDQAIGKWREALPQVKPEYRNIIEKNIGRAYQNWGKLPNAWHHFKLAARLVKEDVQLFEWKSEVEKQLAQAGHCKVTLATTPPGALATCVAFEGESATLTPFEWYFPKGTYIISFEMPDHAKATRSLELKDCSEGSVEVALTPLSKEGTLLLAGAIDDASVTIDGGRLDVPPEGVRLAPGSYVVEVTRPGVIPYRTTVTVEAGKPTTVTVPLGERIFLPGGGKETKEKAVPGWAYAVFGVGLATTVTGVALLGAASSRASDLEDEYSGAVGSEAEKKQKMDDYEAEKSEKVTPLRAAGAVLTGVGGAATIIGAVAWGVAGRRKGDQSTASRFPFRLTPTLPGGFVIEGSF
jgi:hypothetical protein